MDVRTPQEFHAGHIDGAVNVPVKVMVAKQFLDARDFVEHFSEFFDDKGQQAVVGCLGIAGDRARLAIRQLEEAGYHNLIQVLASFVPASELQTAIVVCCQFVQ